MIPTTINPNSGWKLRERNWPGIPIYKQSQLLTTSGRKSLPRIWTGMPIYKKYQQWPTSPFMRNPSYWTTPPESRLTGFELGVGKHAVKLHPGWKSIERIWAGTSILTRILHVWIQNSIKNPISNFVWAKVCLAKDHYNTHFCSSEKLIFDLEPIVFKNDTEEFNTQRACRVLYHSRFHKKVLGRPY